ncbi:MAG: HEAT repeat domain-containing protein [Phycisphaerales bacterium]|nr:HEAT repeat domain-containing protein [Phycisphaerales bacterium]
MGLPPANTVLFFLAAFTALWGASVILRARRARTIPGARRCPECKADMRQTQGRTCPACAYQAPTETALQIRRHDLRSLLVGILSTAGGIALAPAALWVRRWETTGNDETLSIHPLSAAFYGVAAFGLALAVWAYRGDRSNGRRRCPKCWYDMSATIARDAPGAAPLTCPECGHEPASIRALYRPRRRRRATALGLGLVTIGLYGQTVPRALRTGPIGLVPTTVLIVGSRWLPQSWYTGAGDDALRARVSRYQLWDWQLRFGHYLARESLGSRWSCEQAETVALWLSPRDAGDCQLVTEGVLAALSDERFVPSQATAAAVSSCFGSFIGGYQSGRRWSDATTPPPAAAAALPVLIRRLESGHPPEVELSLPFFYIFRLHSEDAVRPLATIAQTKGRGQRLAAVVLGRHFEHSEPARTAMASLLRDDDPATRRAALDGVMEAFPGKMRSQASDLVISVALTDPDESVRGLAAEHIWSSGMHFEPAQKLASCPDLPESARLALLDLLDLGMVEPGLPVLLPLLDSEDPLVVEECLRTLRRFVADMPTSRLLVMQRAARCLTYSDPDVQRAAGELIVRIGDHWPDTADMARQLVPDGESPRPIPED